MAAKELREQRNKELARLFNERMDYMYFVTTPEPHYEYPNSYEGDCLRIAHELSQRIEKGARG